MRLDHLSYAAGPEGLAACVQRLGSRLGAGFTDAVDRLMDDPFVIGAPDECVERLTRLRTLGATHVALRLFWPGMSQKDALAMIDLAAATVLPALHKV